MGTNYYFLTKEKSFVREYFAKTTAYGVSDEEYRLIDEPYFCYEIHICKFSYGWRALFQSHHCYRSLKDLEQFYKEHCSQLEIYNEYNDPITWDTLKKSALEMLMISPSPKKWVYDFEKAFSYSKYKTLHTVDCPPSEAELWFPFDHVLYQKTEKEAIKQFSVYPSYNIRAKYWNDPDYPVDWTEGDFS